MLQEIQVGSGGGSSESWGAFEKLIPEGHYFDMFVRKLNTIKETITTGNHLANEIIINAKNLQYSKINVYQSSLSFFLSNEGEVTTFDRRVTVNIPTNTAFIIVKDQSNTVRTETITLSN